jgi:SAM-dependent methyltransferase
MLEWSARLRAEGRAQECPLLAVASDDSRPCVERAISAGSAWALAKDPRAAAIVNDLVDRLTVLDRLAVQGLVPDLVKELAPYYLHARPEILERIPTGAGDILELGCAAGVLGYAVKSRQACRYVGVELDPFAARIAANALDQVEVFNLDAAELPFGPGTFDCVVCADVLEHLKDPWGVLGQLFALLRPGGRIVVSIPNIRNLGVVAQQLAGDWVYQDAGILDRTHLRFFTRRSFERALVEAGFEINSQHCVFDPPLQSITSHVGEALRLVCGNVQLQLEGLSAEDVTELATVQFLFVASKPKPGPVTQPPIVSESTKRTTLVGPPGRQMAFQVVLTSPDGYAHAAAFAEVMETVVCGLRALGADVSTQVNRLVVPGPPAIVFGANLLQPAEVDLLPAGTIVYNLEQISEESSWCSPAYLQALKACQVWDYSVRNMAALARLGITSTARHVPIGYVPELSRIKPRANEDIDVLFYGSMNERRSQVISRLREAGLNAQAVFGVYGQERDQLIARAKVVLNLHYYSTSIFELVRVSYLLANRKAVVAEHHPGTEVDADMTGAVRLATCDELVPACTELVADRQARQTLAERGFARMAARDERTYLAAVLGLEIKTA